ncbi:hypothetical protein, partial [Actinomadura geliboluensis]|uniref:hypothetical protein n=1 Tax=Actinomadura geliboluensis TaxID=882440 RepID=UPI0026131E8E
MPHDTSRGRTNAHAARPTAARTGRPGRATKPRPAPSTAKQPAKQPAAKPAGAKQGRVGRLRRVELGLGAAPPVGP